MFSPGIWKTCALRTCWKSWCHRNLSRPKKRGMHFHHKKNDIQGCTREQYSNQWRILEPTCTNGADLVSGILGHDGKWRCSRYRQFVVLLSASVGRPYKTLNDHGPFNLDAESPHEASRCNTLHSCGWFNFGTYLIRRLCHHPTVGFGIQILLGDDDRTAPWFCCLRMPCPEWMDVGSPPNMEVWRRFKAELGSRNCWILLLDTGRFSCSVTVFLVGCYCWWCWWRWW